MSMKKTILPHEWDLIEDAAKDPNGSTSRIFDILRSKRAEAGIELMNRSWFLNFLRNVCGCSDGKLKGFRRPQEKVKQQVQETAVDIEKPVEEKLVNENTEVQPKSENEDPESLSDTISKDALFCLRWMFQKRGENPTFASMIKVGFSKKRVMDAASELETQGIITKKNPRRYNEIVWDDVLELFPDVAVMYSEEEVQERMTVHRKKAEKEIEAPVQQAVTPTVKKVVKTPMQKMIDWLLDEEHPQYEITKPEVINELRRLHVENPWQKADQLLEYWTQQKAIVKNRWNEAYQILGTAKLLRLTHNENTTQTDSTPNAVTTIAKDIVLENSKVRIKNESKSKIEVVVRDGEIVIRIID